MHADGYIQKRFLSCLFVLLLLALTLRTARARPYGSRWTPTEIIATRMVGTHLDEEIHTVRALVGTPARELWLAIDFASDTLYVSTAPTKGAVAGNIATSNPADWSSSYSDVDGGSDLIRLSGRRVRVPVVYDSTAATLGGCPACNGVLGVGAGSPLWLVWNHATFSAGAVTLGYKQPQVKGEGRARISCTYLEPDLCVSTASVYGTDYGVRFKFNSSYTLVPWAVYDSYVGSRSISTTPASEWPTLDLVFDSAEAPLDPRQPTLRIVPQSLLGNSRAGGAQTLLLRRSPDPNSDTIILGRSVWRSLMMYREFDTGRAIIQSFASEKRYPTWALFLAVGVALIMARWWTTRDALFYEALPGRFASLGIPQPIQKRFRILPIGVNGIARPTGNGPGGTTTTAYQAGGNVTTPWGGFLGFGPGGVYPGEWGIYPDRLLIELGAIGGAIAVLYAPPLRKAVASKYEFWVFLQVIVYIMIAWNLLIWVTRILGRSDVFGVLHYYYSYSANGTTGTSFVIYRAGLIRQAAVDVMLSVILLMVASLTRTDSLGTTMLTLTAGILSGVMMYHFVASLVHHFRFDYRYPVGRRGETIWYLWILFLTLYLATSATFFSAFIIIPFMQLHVTSANAGDYLLAAAAVYAAGLFLAFVLVNFEADRMKTWLDKMRHRTVHGPQVHPLVRLLRSATTSSTRMLTTKIRV